MLQNFTSLEIRCYCLARKAKKCFVVKEDNIRTQKTVYNEGSQTGVNLTCLGGKFCLHKIHTFTYCTNTFTSAAWVICVIPVHE